ncbi:unnamed protein product [Ostreobium quekettii]|uniref:Uncharacterized protein n=1 Tax=Ostreobium quekettii TaxID=121088 RepID=A0A8S1J3N0_9CHLO|nr:unnamed protein product [Ostreobium quekettii]|eukprot:evm.model.scf_1838.1 EVM.evm.TU.scf_1838.1   scf_1838:1479-6898(+)
MREQARLESGESFGEGPPDKVVGSDDVSDEEAQQYVSDVQRALRVLEAEPRDMTLSEVKLTISIESPRERQLRKMGIENESGASRDEMAVALEEVARGATPNDRIALKALAEEMNEWTSVWTQEADNAEPSSRA